MEGKLRQCQWEYKPLYYRRAIRCGLPALPGQVLCPLHFAKLTVRQRKHAKSPLERLRKALENKDASKGSRV